MKKKIIFLLAGIVSVLSMPSCTDLDEKVYDKMQPGDQYGSTEAEVKAMMGNTYNTLKSYLNERFLYLSENAGSMAVTPTRYGGDWYDGGQFREFYMHTWTAQTRQIHTAWVSASSAIATSNAAIDMLEKASFFNDNDPVKREKKEANRKEYVASMRGVRAFWYYVMLDNWGNIPLVTEYEDHEDLEHHEHGEGELPEITPRQEAFDWLVKEVNEIIDDCPDASDVNYGKFTKGAAYMILAKLYLNAEAWSISVEGNAYQKCIEACNNVMGTGFNYYEFAPNWSDNFAYTNPRPKEAILTACYSDKDANADFCFRMMNLTLHYSDGASEGGRYSAQNGIIAQPDYVQLFVDNNDPRLDATFRIGKRYNQSTGAQLTTGQNNDPLNYTINTDFVDNIGYDDTNWRDVKQESGARCQKWPYVNGLGGAMNNHFHIFRLADVYLMKVEALLRSGGSGATGLVNDFRAHVYNSFKGYDYVPLTDTDVNLERIALERKLEFAWEGWSRQDDIRFGTFEKGSWSASECDRKEGEYLKLYPIPLDAWQTNQKLKQNPGYPKFPNQ
ncbi:SusD family protein [Bacteroidales bacterium Barb6]|nr:SusD family protein [Bacteroidales bacterium Barb6]